MLCPHCNSSSLLATRTDGIHSGRLDCRDCEKMIKWLSKSLVDELLPELQILTDTSSTAFWDEFLKYISSPELEILTDYAVKVGLFNSTLTIILNLPEDDIKFADLIGTTLGFSEILISMRGRWIDVQFASISEWEHARNCTLEQYADVFKKEWLPPEFIFAYYYSGVTNYQDIRSLGWLISKIDETVLLANQKSYRPGWVVADLTRKYYFSREALSYLARSLDYHPAWVDKNLDLYSYAIN